MGERPRILQSYLDKPINNKVRSYNDVINEIKKFEYDKKGFAYLTNYNDRKIVAHGGLSNIGYPSPEFQDIRNVCSNMFSNIYAHELDKASLLLTSKRKYLQQCLFITKKIIQSPHTDLAYLAIRKSELIQFKRSKDIFCYNKGWVLDILSSNTLKPQLGYFVNPHNRVLINESIYINQTAFENTIRRLFREKQRKIFIHILEEKGNLELAKKTAFINRIITNEKEFTYLKAEIRKRLKKFLIQVESESNIITLEFFLHLYSVIIEEKKLESALTFGRFDA